MISLSTILHKILHILTVLSVQNFRNVGNTLDNKNKQHDNYAMLPSQKVTKYFPSVA